TGKTGDQKLKPLPIRPSHLLLTKLNLSDPWRRRILKVPESTPGGEEEETVAPATSSKSETPSEKVSERPKEPAAKRAKPKEKESP
ncbi:MAG TPA: hypothetical protein VIZ68_08355, partial [Thermoplasmata archaeon]